jgi:biopolymer transport protein ExbD
MAREHRELLRATHARARMTLPITPLIDVVFQLLVYFLVTASFLGDERLLRAEAPPADTARTPDDDPFSLEAEPLDITIARAEDGVAISLSGGLPAPSDADALGRLLADLLFSAAQPTGSFAADHPIRIRPAGDVAWEPVVEVYRAVVGAGYRAVAFGGAR